MAEDATDWMATPDEPAETTVLVVDDERSLADLHATFLSEDYEVRTAYSGEGALDTIDDDVDVVLLDRKMPRMSGDEVLAAIRDRGYDCRIVMVTAVEPDFDIIELGFDGYLVKPIDSGDLRERIEEVRARAAYEDRLQEYYALREKRNTLRAAKPEAELESSEEYRQLERELDDVRDRIESFLARFEDERFATAIERTRSVSALREREQRYRSLTEDVLDTSRVGTVILDAEFEVVWVNAATERYFGIDREELLDRDYPAFVRDRLADLFEIDDGDFADRVLAAYDANDGVEEFQCRVRPGEGREERWLKHWSKPIETGLYAGGRIEHYYDVTALKDRERTLETLHGATRDLINAETREETAEVAVEAAETVLGFPVVAVYLWDESSGTLIPGAHTEDMETVRGELDPISGDESGIWEAFVDREPAVESAADGDLASRLLLPLGNHGVLVIGDPAPDAFSAADVSFARVLSANTEVALDRADRERALRERDEELERRNDQLKRLNRINTIIRGIGGALVDASSRADIEQAVCDRLVRVESYRFVWIGEPDVVNDRLVPRASAGDEEGYLDSIAADGGGIVDGPAREAMRTREVKAVGNVLEDETYDGLRSEALNRGYRSVVSVPLRYEETIYGVVEVYADRPFAFDEEERNVLAELGETIGHAINAVKRKEALLFDAGVEVEFELDDPDDVFSGLAERIEGQVDLETVIPQDDGTSLAFFAVADVPADRVIEIAEGFAAVTDVEVVRERDDAVVVECRLDGPTVVTTVAEHGAIPRSVTANRDGCRIVVELPGTADVRSFGETLAARYPDAELVARRENARDGDSRSLQERIDDRLTDRQREALQTAYFAGYFAWPRDNGGEAVAETLGISQPTLQQHLRAGERKLLEALFDGR